MKKKKMKTEKFNGNHLMLIMVVHIIITVDGV